MESEPQYSLVSILCSKAEHYLLKEVNNNTDIQCFSSLDGEPVLYITKTHRELQARVKEYHDTFRSAEARSMVIS